MQIDKLTIELTLDGDRIKAVCPELNLEAHGEYKGEAVKSLQELIDRAVVTSMDKGNSASDFVKRMYGGDDEDEGFDWWLEQARYSRFRKKLEDAFRKAYPSIKDQEFIHMMIPGVDWDEGENYDKWMESQQRAREGLIQDGPSNKSWVTFIQAICTVKYKGWWSVQKADIYKGWKSIGLPVLSQKKMDAMAWEEVEALAFSVED